MNQSVKRIDVKGPHGTWSYETLIGQTIFLLQ